MSKLTTRDMIGALIDLENDLEYLEAQFDPDDAHNSAIGSEIEIMEDKIKRLKAEIATKTSNIDHFIMELTKQSGLIDSEIQTYNNEVKRLKSRKAAIKKTEDYFNKELIPMIIETAGENNVFRTSTTRYKLYETWGKLEVTDSEEIPDKYKRYKVEVDKKGARKDVIDAAENGMGISGFRIQKTKRVRRS